MSATTTKGYACWSNRGILLAANPEALRRGDVDGDARIVTLEENEWRAHAGGIYNGPKFTPILFTRIDQSYAALDGMVVEGYEGTREYTL